MDASWVGRDVATPGGNFVVRQTGSTVNVVLLHDEITTAAGAFGDALAVDAGVLAPVHPGFGSAPRPEWVESIRDVAEHYQDLFDAEGLDGVDLVGVSMGAWIALELALRLGDRVGRLSLIAPIGIHVQDDPPADYWYVRDRDRVLYHDTDKMPALELDDQVANEESAARYGWSPRLHDPTLAPRLHRISQPTQIVWSSEDRLLPSSHLDRWRELLPHADVIEIGGVGHFPTHESPGETADVVGTFVRPASTGATA